MIKLTKTQVLDGLQTDNKMQLSCDPPVHIVEIEYHAEHNNVPCDTSTTLIEYTHSKENMYNLIYHHIQCQYACNTPTRPQILN